MRMPLSNFWAAVPTSRGCQWLQPIKQLMGRCVCIFCTDWQFHWPLHADFAVLFLVLILLLGFNPWSEVWAHRRLWASGPRDVDELGTLRCSWNQRGYKGWGLKLLSQQLHRFGFCSPNRTTWLITQWEIEQRNSC